MRIANHVQSNINSHTDFGAKGRYTTPSGVNDHYTVLLGLTTIRLTTWRCFQRSCSVNTFQDLMTYSQHVRCNRFLFSQGQGVTGRMQTSWLFTSVAENLKSGLSRNESRQWSEQRRQWSLTNRPFEEVAFLQIYRLECRQSFTSRLFRICLLFGAYPKSINIADIAYQKSKILVIFNSLQLFFLLNHHSQFIDGDEHKERNMEITCLP